MVRRAAPRHLPRGPPRRERTALGLLAPRDRPGRDEPRRDVQVVLSELAAREGARRTRSRRSPANPLRGEGSGSEHHTVGEREGDLRRAARLFRDAARRSLRRRHGSAARGGRDRRDGRRQRPGLQRLAREGVAQRVRGPQRLRLRLLQRPDLERGLHADERPGGERPRLGRREPPPREERRRRARALRRKRPVGLRELARRQPPDGRGRAQGDGRIRPASERRMALLAGDGGLSDADDSAPHVHGLLRRDGAGDRDGRGVRLPGRDGHGDGLPGRAGLRLGFRRRLGARFGRERDPRVRRRDLHVAPHRPGGDRELFADRDGDGHHRRRRHGELRRRHPRGGALARGAGEPLANGCRGRQPRARSPRA